jgi:hypothetical protein
MDKKGIDLAAALAGQVNRDLQDVPNRAPINPQEFLRKAGVPVNTPQPTPARNYPGMIEAPKSTPAGSEVIGVEVPAPNLIPIPDDLKKFVEDIPEVAPTAPPVAPTQPEPEPWTRSTLSQSAPPSDKVSLSDVITDIQQRLDRIEQFMLKRDKYWSKSRNNKSKKKSTKNETNSAPFSGSSQTAGAAPKSEA